jgi:stage III sporulation protein AG
MSVERFSAIKKRIGERLWKNKYILAVMLLGAVLIILPTSTSRKVKETPMQQNITEFSVKAEEARLEAVLSKIDGAGKVSVLLSVKSGGERIVAVDEDTSETDDKSEATNKTVIISAGTSTEEAVVLKYIYPQYVGAVIVAEGAGSSVVKLHLSEAVAAATGLGSDKIKVVKMNS